MSFFDCENEKAHWEEWALCSFAENVRDWGAVYESRQRRRRTRSQQHDMQHMVDVFAVELAIGYRLLAIWASVKD